VRVNCGAIPENLIESELFGYVKGAFTGAISSGKLGLFELANKGTIFLDEIGELPLSMQSKLLHVLQEGVVTRIGDVNEIKLDVRVVTATNRNLESMVFEGKFRSDLYYRLNVMNIEVPPLRDRIDDIPGLAEKTIYNLNKKYVEEKIITKNFINLLIDRDWPGNVREMQNFIEKQFVISDENIMDSFIISDEIISNAESKIMIKGIIPLRDAIKEVEKILVTRAMKQTNNTYKAAELLETSQSTLFRKYKEILGEALEE
jgi:transcriptional regulator with PAS, ATPase and Fis domain